MDVEWWSVDFKTGERMWRVEVADGAKLSRIIGEPTDTVIQVRASNDGVAIPGWDEGTQGRRSMLVAVEKAGDQIVFGGLVRNRSRKTGPWINVSLDTLEAYFFQRYIGSSLSWSDADPTQVAVDALNQITGLDPLEIRPIMTGRNVIDGFIDENDRKRVGELLTELSEISGGPEWTVDLEWADADHTQMLYVIRNAPRIGSAGGVAATQWTMPGCVKDFDYVEDFGEQNFANDVIAFSSGEGDSRPRSTRYEDTALLAAYARFERRFDPARSLTSTTTLDQYAEAELARTRLGLTSLKLIANLDAAPQINRDWWIGDDIDVTLTCDSFPERSDSDGFKVAGFERRLRTVGWDLDLGGRTIAPRIMEAS